MNQKELIWLKKEIKKFNKRVISKTPRKIQDSYFFQFLIDLGFDGIDERLLPNGICCALTDFVNCSVLIDDDFAVHFSSKVPHIVQ